MTPDEIRKTIKRINKHQNNTNFHPLTCGNDSSHGLLIPKEIRG